MRIQIQEEFQVTLLKVIHPGKRDQGGNIML